MSAQKGKDLLLKVKPDPLQGFITVAGIAFAPGNI